MMTTNQENLRTYIYGIMACKMMDNARKACGKQFLYTRWSASRAVIVALKISRFAARNAQPRCFSTRGKT